MLNWPDSPLRLQYRADYGTEYPLSRFVEFLSVFFFLMLVTCALVIPRYLIVPATETATAVACEMYKVKSPGNKAEKMQMCVIDGARYYRSGISCSNKAN